MSADTRPGEFHKCFVARFRSTRCHVELMETATIVKATPWVEDRLLVRPVLDTSGHQPEFLAKVEGAALVAVIQFLAGRLGPLEAPPRPCEAREHIKATALPFGWTDELRPTRA